MNNKKPTFCILSLALVIFGLSGSQTYAQPSAAQLKKLFTLPNAVSVVVHKPGAKVWSSTYKKYVWNIGFTVKNKTDTPGVLRIVRGYSSFDIIGGRYVYWRDFISENSYEGIKNPTVAEINQALTHAELRDFNGGVIGEYESMKISPDPIWEWHTMNSVSFNVVAVFRTTYHGGTYADEPQHQWDSDFTTIDKIESTLRIRLYRNAPNVLWHGAGVSRSQMGSIYNSKGETVRAERLLERKDYPTKEVEQMPRLTRIPLLTQ